MTSLRIPALLLMATTLASQELIYEVMPPAGIGQIGLVGLVGDVNGDTVPDMLVTDEGSYWMVSGRSGQYLTSALAGPSLPIRKVHALGDVTGDQVPEFITVTDRVEVRQRNWSVLYSLPGAEVAIAGDQNGDGRPDFFMLDGVHSGRDGSLVRALPLLDHIATIGDWDRDGVLDVATKQRSGSGGLLVVSGQSGATLASYSSVGIGPIWGVTDHDNDGYSDVVTASTPMPLLQVVSIRQSRVLVYNIAGQYVTIAGDLDGDSHEDVITWDQFLTLQQYRVWSLPGLIGVTIYSYFSGYSSTTRYGGAGLGDINGNGLSDFAISDIPGRVRVYGRVPPRYREFGAACVGSWGAPRLTVPRAPAVGTSFDVSVSPLQPFTGSYLAIGFSNTNWAGVPLPFNLASLGAPGCTIYVSGDSLLPFFSTNTIASWSIPLPNDYNLLYTRFFVQCLSLDVRANALGLIATSAGEAVVGG